MPRWVRAGRDVGGRRLLGRRVPARTNRATRCSARTCRSCTSTASSTGAAGRRRGPTRPRSPGSRGSRSRSCDLTEAFDGRGDRRLRRRSTRRAARRTRARGATARSSSARSCGGPTSWGSTWSPPATTSVGSATTPARGICCAARTPTKDQTLHAPHARPGAARAVDVPGGRACRRHETRAHAERFGLPVAGKPDSQELCFAPAGDAGGVRPRPRRPRWCAPAARSSTRTAGCSASTTARSRSRWASAAGSASRPARRSTCSRSTRRRTASSSGPAELLARRGLVADRASWVAGRAAADGPFEAEVRIRYRGEDVPRGGHARRRPAVRVEFARPQRRRARAERRGLPRRRGARRRPDRRGAPLRPVGRAAPTRRQAADATVRLLRRRAKASTSRSRTWSCTSPRPRTTRRSRGPRPCRSGSSSSPTAPRPRLPKSKRPLADRRTTRRPSCGSGRSAAAAGVGPDVHLPGGGRSTRSAGSSARAMHGGHGVLRRRPFIVAKKRLKLAVKRRGGEPSRSSSVPDRCGVGVSTTLGRGGRRGARTAWR